MSTPSDFTFSLASSYAYNNTIDLSQFYTSSSTGAVTFTVNSGFESYVSITGTIATMTGVINNVSITATQLADATYAAGYAVATFNIVKANIQQLGSLASLNISLNVGQTLTLNETIVPSGLPIVYTSNNTSVFTVNGNIATAVGVGTAIVYIGFAGNDNYNSVSQAPSNTTITVSKGTSTFTLSPVTKTYGNAPFTLSDTTSEGLPLTYTSSDPTIISITGNTATVGNAGTSTITATFAGNNNYNPIIQPVTFTVNKATPTITYTGALSRTWGDAPFTLNATSNAPGTISYISGAPDVIKLSGPNGTTATIVGVYGCGIYVNIPASQNYRALDMDYILNFVVQPKIPTITFNRIYKKIGDTPFTLRANSDSPGTFTYSSSDDNIVSINGTTATVVGEGSTTITAQFLPQSNNFSSGTAYATIEVNSILSTSICFPAGTPVLTDQGEIAIDKINPEKNTIRGKKIVAVTKTITIEDKIVCIEKNALGPNIPSQKTFISRNHQLLFNKKMIKAKHLIGQVDGIYNKKYNGEILYNVLLETHDKMIVNNLIVETLNPTNIVAQLYNENFSTEEKNIIISNINSCAEEYKKHYGHRR